VYAAVLLVVASSYVPAALLATRAGVALGALVGLLTGALCLIGLGLGAPCGLAGGALGAARPPGVRSVPA
jgi:hypothetical protein